jgi:hypothetical protein
LLNVPGFLAEDDEDELEDDDRDEDDVLSSVDELLSLLDCDELEPLAATFVFLSSSRKSRNAAIAMISAATTPTAIHFALLFGRAPGGGPTGPPGGGPTGPGGGTGATGGIACVGGGAAPAPGVCCIACVAPGS